jgi:Spy/CpxP family protein refolding chaperone
MDIFTQNKNLVRTVILLVLLNLILIAFLVWKEVTRSPPRGEPALFPKQEEFRDVAGILKERLNLTEVQVVQVQKIRSDFFEKEQNLTLIIRNEKDSMNIAMFNKITDENIVQHLAKQITENGYKIQLLRIEQAKSLKAICTSKQQEKLEDLVIEIRDYFRPDNQPKK